MRSQNQYDLSIGEAELVADSFGFSKFSSQDNYDLTYQDVGGYKPLIDYLESKYNKKVTITCGAKQAVHASLSYMKNLRYSTMNIVHPYWNVFSNTFKHYDFAISNDFYQTKNAFDFIVSPNNPDGAIYQYTPHNLAIHDAVYNLPYFTDNVKDIGNVTIYSASKMLGLSSFRVGWILSNETSKQFFSNYVEEMTVGVSLPAQKMVLSALQYADKCEAGKKLIKSTLIKNKLSMIEALKPYGQFEQTDSIFLFGKTNKKLPKELTVAYYPEGFVRINCCVSEDKIAQVIQLLK